ncbi:hypothetical protein HJC23_003606 [Cyclotella cryptica]|uniref:Helicase-associated domain-containing protein n=1 Tax=Cyclotella cryptica TaxID=29204 RepID=A0ABD3QQX9_9STRA|eukprot:CCRYP_004893-RA/>CCRYP_004893-RA protein AED:0.04 eAED:0.04 QI:199/1/1/1/1/1/3/758/445
MRALIRCQPVASRFFTKKLIVDSSRSHENLPIHCRQSRDITFAACSILRTQFAPNLDYHSFLKRNLIVTAEDDDDDDSTDNTKTTTNFTSHWDAMFQCLKDYKAKHGDTLVPATYLENPPLGNWVDNNRQAYRMRLEAEKEDTIAGSKKHIMMMTDEKIEALESIGFVWNVLDHAWNSRYEELCQYIKEHGNSLVPHRYKDNPSLGLWVHKQRRNYKVNIGKCSANPPPNIDNETSLSPERIQKLNEIGFIWDVHEAQWLERFEELRKYRRDHGDTLVPRSYPVYPFLGKWVEKQRSGYKKFMAKRKFEEDGRLDHNLDELEVEKLRKSYTGMSVERIRLLESEDFIWDPLDHAWHLKYEELCEWIAMNGHGAIRRRRKSYDPLEGWAEMQRRNYVKYLNGVKTSLTEDRIEKLNRAGFVFQLENAAPPKKSRRALKKQSVVSKG